MVRAGDGFEERVELPSHAPAPVAQGAVIGRLVLRSQGRTLGSVPLVAGAAWPPRASSAAPAGSPDGP